MPGRYHPLHGVLVLSPNNYRVLQKGPVTGGRPDVFPIPTSNLSQGIEVPRHTSKKTSHYNTPVDRLPRLISNICIEATPHLERERTSEKKKLASWVTKTLVCHQVGVAELTLS